VTDGSCVVPSSSSQGTRLHAGVRPAPAGVRSVQRTVRTPALSLVVPIYDEALALPRLLATLLPVAEELVPSFEVLLVDDGSRDASLELCAAAARGDARIRVLPLGRHRGKGAAVRHGIRAAQAPLRVFLDADLATGLDALPRLLRRLESGADFAIGSRSHPAARVEAPQPPWRAALGRWFRALARRSLGLAQSDVTCGFKGVRASAVPELFGPARVDGWAFDAELLTIARERRLRVCEVPVVWSDRGRSKVRVVSAACGAARDLVRIVLHRARGRYR